MHDVGIILYVFLTSIPSSISSVINISMERGHYNFISNTIKFICNLNHSSLLPCTQCFFIPSYIEYTISTESELLSSSDKMFLFLRFIGVFLLLIYVEVLLYNLSLYYLCDVLERDATMMDKECRTHM